MSLRLQLQMIVSAVSLAMLALAIGLHVSLTRASVKEEVVAANRVAMQFVGGFLETYGSGGIDAAERFVRELGRIRANEIELRDLDGAVRYRSPPSTYKAGREAPAWYAQLISPGVSQRSFPLVGGSLVVRSDPTRSVLDGWDDLRAIAGGGLLLAVIAVLASAWVAGRVLTPLGDVAEGLRAASAGRFDHRAPVRGGAEGRALAEAFNGLMAAVAERDAARDRAVQAEQQRDLNRDRAALAEQQRDLSRELALRFERELEAERRAIARDLHDDLGQHATALKTLAATFERRLAVTEPSLAQLATLMVRSADALFAAIRGMINRVRPEALERGGLVDGLRALVGDWRLRQAGTRFELLLEPADDAEFGLGDAEVEAAAYRIVQEAVTNAVRHAGAELILVSARVADGRLTLQVSDDGRGLGHGAGNDRGEGSGLRSMRERAEAFSGTLTVGNGESGGTELIAVLPWPGPATV